MDISAFCQRRETFKGDQPAARRPAVLGGAGSVPAESQTMAGVSAVCGVLACLLLTALTSRGQVVGAAAESVLETLVQKLADDVSKLEARVTQMEGGRGGGGGGVL